MPVTVKDFWDSAASLASGSREIDRRNAVSRAYYSAFLWATAQVEACQPLPYDVSAKGSHEQVILRYQHHGSKIAKSVAYQLTALKNMRVIADYKPSMTMTDNEAASAVADAATIIGKISTCWDISSPLEPDEHIESAG